jgi:hypothetical protein
MANQGTYAREFKIQAVALVSYQIRLISECIVIA